MRILFLLLLLGLAGCSMPFKLPPLPENDFAANFVRITHYPDAVYDPARYVPHRSLDRPIVAHMPPSLQELWARRERRVPGAVYPPRSR